MAIQHDAADLQREVLEEDYYVRLYSAALAKHGMTMAGVEMHEYPAGRLVSMANTFWFALPDSPTIRRGPFFRLCNIAEQGCDEEPD